MYRRLSSYNDTSRLPFHFTNRNIDISLDENKEAKIYFEDSCYSFDYFPDFAKYLSGGWLEEYTYLQLKPLLDEGIITDIRIGFEIEWKQSTKTTAQEFDVIFTNSRQLFILECKAGNIISSDIIKLQNNVRDYAGVDGRGALIAAFMPHHVAVRNRVEGAKNIAMFVDEAIPNRLSKRILNISGKGVYTPPRKK